MAHAETITWRSPQELLPDSDMTVLIQAPALSEPVWLGWYDDGKGADGLEHPTWFSLEGDEAGEVIAWALMPRGVTP